MSPMFYTHDATETQASKWESALGLTGLSGLLRLDHVREGLPVAAFQRFAEASGVGLETLASALGISLRTVQRRNGSGERLDAGPSERLVRLAELYARTSSMTGSDDMASQWMQTPRDVFGGRTPFELAGSELGAREVEDLLSRIEYGVFY